MRCKVIALSLINRAKAIRLKKIHSELCLGFIFLISQFENIMHGHFRPFRCHRGARRTTESVIALSLVNPTKANSLKIF